MTQKKMILVIDEAIDFFIAHMPLVPFSKDDIVVEFFTLRDANERYVRLCKQYFPRKLDGRGFQEAEIFDDAAVMALVGEKKVGIFIRSDLKVNEADFRHEMLHELAHIFCVLNEMPERDHFIDIYLGCTPDVDFPTSAARQEDGIISAGYEVWREFIADYIALKLDPKGYEHDFRSAVPYMKRMLEQVSAYKPVSKRCISNLLVTLMTCSDGEKAVDHANTLMKGSAQLMLSEIAAMVYEHTRICPATEWNTAGARQYPWEIDRQFIYDLGSKYLMLITYMMLG